MYLPTYLIFKLTIHNVIKVDLTEKYMRIYTNAKGH